MSLFLNPDLTDHWGLKTRNVAQDKHMIKQMADRQQHKANKAFTYNIHNIMRDIKFYGFAACFKGFKMMRIRLSWKCYTNPDITSGIFSLFSGKVLFNIMLFRYCFVIQQAFITLFLVRIK